MKSRRQFLIGSLATAAAASNLRAAAEAPGWNYIYFTKPLQTQSWEDCAKTVAELGFQGVEALVRPGGQVEPERVEEDLPKFVEALKKQNLELTIMASGINAVDPAQHTEKVLRTAAALGIKRFRMSYYKYDLTKPIFPQLDQFRPILRDLVALGKELGIKPVYQNHSGRNYVSAPLWDLYELFREFDPAHVGSGFDIGHATLEGGYAWELNFHLLRPYIDTIYVKEPHWENNRPEFGPLGAGGVEPRFFKMVKESKFNGPINLHVEYLGEKAETVPTIIEASRRDFATLKRLLS